ncbi:protein of unknown function [Candidatus Nitrotoga arctica]|uniref:Uncharacterized protein n=1 Tax=Candidatus Nitrotoga arctica TaxID=453162 RepID=A0ABM8YY67_9PROT|nr:protein of unknown function [Candidatus Nitrotoga arctica]
MLLLRADNLTEKLAKIVRIKGLTHEHF